MEMKNCPAAAGLKLRPTMPSVTLMLNGGRIKALQLRHRNVYHSGDAILEFMVCVMCIALSALRRRRN